MRQIFSIRNPNSAIKYVFYDELISVCNEEGQLHIIEEIIFGGGSGICRGSGSAAGRPCFRCRRSDRGRLQNRFFTAIIEDIEKTYFEAALDLTGGNESKAALLLNLTRDKFRYRRNKLSIA